VAIKEEDTFAGEVNVSLDGIKTWLDLILKLITMKIGNSYVIVGVRKIFVGEIEAKGGNDILETDLGSVVAVCILGGLGVFFIFEYIF
jgi:hypothetical protein